MRYTLGSANLDHAHHVSGVGALDGMGMYKFVVSGMLQAILDGIGLPPFANGGGLWPAVCLEEGQEPLCNNSTLR